jgi:hypothetical protein
MLALGLVVKTPQRALDESTPTWNFNVALDASLAAQTADAQVGAAMLMTGFGIQMAGALGWHESSWVATGIALASAIATASLTWVFLVFFWRPRRIRAILVARLRSLDMGLWWPALAAYGDRLKIHFSGDPETIAEFGQRLLGARLWARATEGRELSDEMTKPRSELAGTVEYEEARRPELDSGAS